MEEIALKRIQSGLRQYEVAKRVGILPSRLCEIEKGRRQASPELLAQIEQALERKMPYEEWALKVIACICKETQVNSALKVEEIKCVVRRDGAYLENYADGDTPEEAWSGELGAIADSQ